VRTSWDISVNLFADAAGINMQQTRVHPKSAKGKIGVIALAAGAIFAAAESPILTHDAGCSSSTIIAVRHVERAVAAGSSRVQRKARDEFEPDGLIGMSTARLAQTFSALFEPIDEPEPDVDYSFG
jgi:hypothetical protein